MIGLESIQVAYVYLCTFINYIKYIETTNDEIT